MKVARFQSIIFLFVLFHWATDLSRAASVSQQQLSSSDRTNKFQLSSGSSPESLQNILHDDATLLTNVNTHEEEKEKYDVGVPKKLIREETRGNIYLRGASNQGRFRFGAAAEAEAEAEAGVVGTANKDRGNHQEDLSSTTIKENNSADEKDRLLQKHDATLELVHRQLDQNQQPVQSQPQPQPQPQPQQNDMGQENILPGEEQPQQQPQQPQQQDAQSEQQGQQEQTNFDNQMTIDEGKATVPPFILLLAAVFAAYMIRKKMIENNWSNSNSSSPSYQYHGLTRGLVGASINGARNGSSNSNSSTNSFGSDYDDDYDDDNFTYGLSVSGNDSNSNSNSNGNGKNISINSQQRKKSSFGFRSSSSSSKKSIRAQEMVPLSNTSNEDEWGWEDSNANRDLEMGVSKTGAKSSMNTKASDKQKDDLQMALGSLKSPPPLPPPPPPQQQHQLNVDDDDDMTPTTSNNNLNTVTVKDSWDEDSANWEEHEPSSKQTLAPVPSEVPTKSTSTSSSSSTQKPNKGNDSKTDTIEEILKNNFAGSTITSFSKPKPAVSSSSLSSTSSAAAKAKKKKKVVEEEDIFASMGLSTMPTPKSSVSSSSSAKKLPNVVPTASKDMDKKSTSNSLSAAVLSPSGDSESLNGGGKWDDDSDLDDLLED